MGNERREVGGKEGWRRKGQSLERRIRWKMGRRRVEKKISKERME